MLITLLTDFGTADYFVGAMKGAILSVNEQARIIDITHEIPPHDIRSGAFTLLNSYDTFPSGTIHVAVVDPGVGSERRPILISSSEYYFVGPDNGLFTYVYERLSNVRVYHLTNSEFFRQPVSSTFQGRDVFAPVAAAVSKGTRPERFGEEIDDPVRLGPLTPQRIDRERIDAQIISIDRFGNCITNITRDLLTDDMIERGARLKINDRAIHDFRQYFKDGADDDATAGAVFAIWGSAGFLEIASNGTSAASLLGASTGQAVTLFQPVMRAGE